MRLRLAAARCFPNRCCDSAAGARARLDHMIKTSRPRCFPPASGPTSATNSTWYPDPANGRQNRAWPSRQAFTYHLATGDRVFAMSNDVSAIASVRPPFDPDVVRALANGCGGLTWSGCRNMLQSPVMPQCQNDRRGHNRPERDRHKTVAETPSGCVLDQPEQVRTEEPAQVA
jgi:hypothetical protein